MAPHLLIDSSLTRCVTPLLDESAFDQKNPADLAKKIKVTPFKYSHVRRATHAFIGAFEDDPLIRYLAADKPEEGPIKGGRNWAATHLLIALWKNSKVGLTVNKGQALVAFLPPRGDPASPARRRKAISDWMTLILLWTFRASHTQAQKKRAQEVKSKLIKLMSETIGERIGDMVALDLLYTAPAFQGQGYGSALVQAVNKFADSRHRAAWLTTNSKKNVHFYNSLGYEVKDYFSLGDGDPDWKEDPVIISLMVREATPIPEDKETSHT